MTCQQSRYVVNVRLPFHLNRACVEQWQTWIIFFFFKKVVYILFAINWKLESEIMEGSLLGIYVICSCLRDEVPEFFIFPLCDIKCSGSLPRCASSFVHFRSRAGNEFYLKKFPTWKNVFFFKVKIWLPLEVLFNRKICGESWEDLNKLL